MIDNYLAKQHDHDNDNNNELQHTQFNNKADLDQIDNLNLE